MPDKGRLYGKKTGFGDGGKGRGQTTYVVQAGDSYAKLAQRFKGDQRAYDEFLRANGYQALVPGMTINIPQGYSSNYFVSNRGVEFAQKSTNANYKGPVMQNYDTYRANYNAAIAAGYTGVAGTSLQQYGPGAGTPGTQAGTSAPGGVNWNTPQQAPGSYYNPDTTTQPAPATATGQSAAAQWQAQDQQRKTRAAVNQGNAIERTLVGMTPKGTPGQAPQSTIGQNANPLFPNGPLGSIGPNASTIAQNFPPSSSANGPTTATAQTSTPGASSTSPAAQAVLQRYTQEAATATAQAVLTNTSVPVYIDPAQVQVLEAMAATDPKLNALLGSLYEYGPLGGLYQNGSLYMPGTQGQLGDNQYPPQQSSDYSNTPPAGYDDTFHGRTGRRRRDGGGRRGIGYRINDYTLGLGQ